MSGDRPYKIWSADQYVCPECGNAIVSGFANSPIAELYQPDYAKVLEQSKEQYILYREDGQ